MMKRATRWLIAGMVLFVVAAGPATAESPAATAQWLNSIGLSYRNKPWDVDAVLKAYSVDLTRARKFAVKDVQFLRAMPRLRRVDLGHPRFGDDELAAVAALPQVTSLRLSRAAVTPDGLAVFERMPRLRTLSLASMQVSEAVMAHVAKLRSLQSLDLSRATVDDAALAQLSRLPALRRLGLSSAKGITRAGLAAIGNIPNLQSLNLQFVPVNEELAELAAATRLRSLTVMRTAVNDQGAAAIAQIKSLRSLYAWHTGISDAGLTALATLPQLETLYLSSTGVTDAGMASIARITTLKTLWLDRTALSDVGVRALSQMPNLRWLKADQTGISDASINVFVSMRALRSLGLRKTQVTGAGLGRLKAARPDIRVYASKIRVPAGSADDSN